jgi:hypothetical protein
MRIVVWVAFAAGGGFLLRVLGYDLQLASFAYGFAMAHVIRWAFFAPSQSSGDVG